MNEIKIKKSNESKKFSEMFLEEKIFTIMACLAPFAILFAVVVMIVRW